MIKRVVLLASVFLLFGFEKSFSFAAGSGEAMDAEESILLVRGFNPCSDTDFAAGTEAVPPSLSPERMADLRAFCKCTISYPAVAVMLLTPEEYSKTRTDVKAAGWTLVPARVSAPSICGCNQCIELARIGCGCNECLSSVES